MGRSSRRAREQRLRPEDRVAGYQRARSWVELDRPVHYFGRSSSLIPRPASMSVPRNHDLLRLGQMISNRTLRRLSSREAPTGRAAGQGKGGGSADSTSAPGRAKLTTRPSVSRSSPGGRGSLTKRGSSVLSRSRHSAPPGRPSTAAGTRTAPAPESRTRTSRCPGAPGRGSEVDGQGAVVESVDVERVALGARGPLLPPQGEERAVEPLQPPRAASLALSPQSSRLRREGRLGLRVGDALRGPRGRRRRRTPRTPSAVPRSPAAPAPRRGR